MIEYERVSEAPKEIRKDEFVIYRPDFLKEIKKAKGRVGDNGITTLGRLRNIFIEVGQGYNELFSAYTHVNLSNFVGLEYKNEKDLSKIVCKIVDLQIPDAVDMSIESQLKKMPSGVNKIYFVADDLLNTSTFSKHHIQMVDKDLTKLTSNKEVKKLNKALAEGPKKTDKKTKSKDKNSIIDTCRKR